MKHVLLGIAVAAGLGLACMSTAEAWEYDRSSYYGHGQREEPRLIVREVYVITMRDHRDAWPNVRPRRHYQQSWYHRPPAFRPARQHYDYRARYHPPRQRMHYRQPPRHYNSRYGHRRNCR